MPPISASLYLPALAWVGRTHVINNSKQTFHGDNRQRQRGIALVMGLILLVVITIIGIAAIRATTQQERMAANNQQQVLTFQTAEQAIRFMMTNDLRTAPVPPAQSLLVNAMNNSGTLARTTPANSYGTTATATIAYGGSQIAPNSSLGGSNCCVAYQFSITSIATQAGSNAYDQHVQGVQRIGPNP
jgi:Tfp pilus assembly protein PilV